MTAAAEKNELTRAEFEQESALLAMEIAVVVLQPKQPLRTTLVMDALMRLYFHHAKHLPADAQKDCAAALCRVARQLLESCNNVQPTAPSGASAH